MPKINPPLNQAEKIEVLAVWFSRQREVRYKHLKLLFVLDDLWSDHYGKHRIKKGFAEAQIIATKEVIKQILEL